MVSRTSLLMITLTSLMGVSTNDFEPIHFPGPTNAQQSIVRDKHSSSSQDWQQTQHKDPEPKTANTNPSSSLRAQTILRDNIPRPLYSTPLNQVGGYPNSYVQQQSNNPVPKYQWFPHTAFERSPNIPNTAFQQSLINPNAVFQQSQINANVGFQQSPINPNPGFQQSPINPNIWFQQSPIDPNAGFQQPLINLNAGFQQSPINPNAGFQQSPIATNLRFQQSPIFPHAGYQQFPYTTSTGYQPFPYRSFQQSPYIPSTLYQQHLNTGFQHPSKNSYKGYQQTLNTEFEQSPTDVNFGHQRSPTSEFQQFNSTGFNAGSQQNPPLAYQEVPESVHPKIYSLDNLIVIVNPPQTQPQPCIPLTPHNPQEPTTDEPDDLKNRMGDEGPSKCTWAIVACCSPENTKVRHNCFELLGCPGFFIDNNPCDPKMVEVAAGAALDYYREANKPTSGATSTNTI